MLNSDVAYDFFKFFSLSTDIFQFSLVCQVFRRKTLVMSAGGQAGGRQHFVSGA